MRRVLITGGTGVLGRATMPLLLQGGHRVLAPGRGECDLFDPVAVARDASGCDAVMHLATRIPPRERRTAPDAWAENDRLRQVAAQLLVDAAIRADPQVFVQPTVAFIYPGEAPVDESTKVEHVPPHLQSALRAEAHALRFAAAGRRGSCFASVCSMARALARRSPIHCTTHIFTSRMQARRSSRP
jgi:nucleoside-diphosphate-sugar epimerase